MQKWLPDEFTSSPVTPPVAAAPRPAWNRLSDADAVAGPAERFQKESRFADPTSLMANMTRDERALVFELVEQDVARAYEEREAALKLEQARQLEEISADYEQRLQRWADEFGARVAAHTQENLHRIGQASARLAVQLAGKLTRALVPVDPEILVRALQTTLYKLPANQPVTVRMHPDDAAWLEEREDLRRQLHVDTIETDRRIEPGGCTVHSGGAEWDASLAGQLESLAEVVAEAISTADGAPREGCDVPPPPESAPDTAPGAAPDRENDHDDSTAEPTP